MSHFPGMALPKYGTDSGTRRVQSEYSESKQDYSDRLLFDKDANAEHIEKLEEYLNNPDMSLHNRVRVTLRMFLDRMNGKRFADLMQSIDAELHRDFDHQMMSELKQTILAMKRLRGGTRGRRRRFKKKGRSRRTRIRRY